MTKNNSGVIIIIIIIALLPAGDLNLRTEVGRYRNLPDGGLNVIYRQCFPLFYHFLRSSGQLY